MGHQAEANDDFRYNGIEVCNSYQHTYMAKSISTLIICCLQKYNFLFFSCYLLWIMVILNIFDISSRKLHINKKFYENVIVPTSHHQVKNPPLFKHIGLQLQPWSETNSRGCLMSCLNNANFSTSIVCIVWPFIMKITMN